MVIGGATSFTTQRSGSLGMDSRGARRLGSSWGQANADGKEVLISPDSVTVLRPIGALGVC